MEYEVTQHASQVILEREIDPLWIDHTLDEPTIAENDPDDELLEHRFRRIEEYGNRVLRVVFNKTTKPIRIVTVYFDGTMQKRL